MRMILIAVHKDEKENLEGFRILGEDSGREEVTDMKLERVKSVIGKFPIEGIEPRTLTGSNGSFDRYPLIINGRTSEEEFKKVVISKALTIDGVVSGYRIFNVTGRGANVRDYELKALKFKGINLANGKWVEKDGKVIISSISGTYPSMEIPKEKEDTEKKRKVMVQKATECYTEEQKREMRSNLISNFGSYSIPKVTRASVSASVLSRVDERYGLKMEEKLLYCIKEMELLRPYYYAVFLNIERVETYDLDTMGVAMNKLYMNPNFIVEGDMGSLLFVHLHEILHIAMAHEAREQKRDHEMWNVACDLFVNRMLVVELKLREDYQDCESMINSKRIRIRLPESALYDNRIDIDKDTPETIYKELEKESKTNSQGKGQQGKGNQGKGQGQGQQGNGQGNGKGQEGQGQSGQSGQQGNGQGNGQGQGKEYIFRGKSVMSSPEKKKYKVDMVKDPDSEKCTQSQKEQKAKSLINRSIQTAKEKKYSDGTGGAMLEVMNNINARKVRWDRILQDRLNEASTTYDSFSTPDRRFITRGKTYPGPADVEPDTLNGVKVCIDTSGSISTVELSKALKQVKQLLDEYNAKAELMYWGTRVEKIEPFTDVKSMLAIKPVDGGGTNCNCVFEYFTKCKDYRNNKKVPPSLILIFTDGVFGELDNKYKKYGKDTVFIISEEGDQKFKPRYGTVAKMGDKFI